MGYSYRIFDSIEHVDASEWQHVRSACNGSIFMDPQFIAAVEAGMKQVETWYIVVHDQAVLMACASASAVTMDLADFADPGLARIIRFRPLQRSCSAAQALIGGLPVGTGHHSLALAEPRRARGSFPCWTG